MQNASWPRRYPSNIPSHKLNFLLTLRPPIGISAMLFSRNLGTIGGHLVFFQKVDQHGVTLLHVSIMNCWLHMQQSGILPFLWRSRFSIVDRSQTACDHLVLRFCPHFAATAAPFGFHLWMQCEDVVSAQSEKRRCQFFVSEHTYVYTTCTILQYNEYKVLHIPCKNL